jgi:membrane fusion protein, multidrug efflux system
VERTTAAAVKQAQANLELARLDLGYADVTAPIAGRAGRALVTEGTLVGQGEATLLTTVERIDPIYVNFSQSPGELQDLRLDLRRALVPGARGADALKVEVLLPDGSPHPQPGNLDFSDLAVDPGTGALSLRATVPETRTRPCSRVSSSPCASPRASWTRPSCCPRRPWPGIPPGPMSWWWRRGARWPSAGSRPMA